MRNENPHDRVRRLIGKLRIREYNAGLAAGMDISRGTDHRWKARLVMRERHARMTYALLSALLYQIEDRLSRAEDHAGWSDRAIDGMARYNGEG